MAAQHSWKWQYIYIELSIKQAPHAEPTKNKGRRPLMNLQRNLQKCHRGKHHQGGRLKYFV
jgi:hypothetical protein